MREGMARAISSERAFAVSRWTRTHRYDESPPTKNTPPACDAERVLLLGRSSKPEGSYIGASSG